MSHRIAEYHAAGTDEFILSGYPHTEEALWFSERVIPALRKRKIFFKVHAASSPRTAVFED
ncbi:MAG TPA: hypothetical protein VGD78_15100 [Chthoniobacterales bacterium]